MRNYTIPILLVIIGCQSTPKVIQSNNSAKKGATSEPSNNYTIQSEAELSSTGWTKVFEDNFDVSPNDSKNINWNVWGGGASNNELQMYTSYQSNLTVIKDPAESQNNLLVIKANKQKIVGAKYRRDVDATPTKFDFTSARIESKKMFAPNNVNSQLRIASRIKLPSGYGMWPAFWLYGDRWPTNGEIDILEARGNERNKFQTNHFYGVIPDRNLVKNQEGFITTTTDLTQSWHVYEVIWKKNSLVFLLDGQMIMSRSDNYIPNLFERLERITFNLAVGGDFFYKDGIRPTADQISIKAGEGMMLVDWVKVFVKK